MASLTLSIVQKEAKINAEALFMIESSQHLTEQCRWVAIRDVPLHFFTDFCHLQVAVTEVVLKELLYWIQNRLNRCCCLWQRIWNFVLDHLLVTIVNENGKKWRNFLSRLLSSTDINCRLCLAACFFRISQFRQQIILAKTQAIFPSAWQILQKNTSKATSAY